MSGAARRRYTNDKSYANTVSSTSSVGLPRVGLSDGGESLWKFRRNSKAKSNMGVFHEVSR